MNSKVLSVTLETNSCYAMPQECYNGYWMYLGNFCYSM